MLLVVNIDSYKLYDTFFERLITYFVLASQFLQDTIAEKTKEQGTQVTVHEIVGE